MQTVAACLNPFLDYFRFHLWNVSKSCFHREFHSFIRFAKRFEVYLSFDSQAAYKFQGGGTWCCTFNAGKTFWFRSGSRYLFTKSGILNMLTGIVNPHETSKKTLCLGLGYKFYNHSIFHYDSLASHSFLRDLTSQIWFTFSTLLHLSFYLFCVFWRSAPLLSFFNLLSSILNSLLELFLLISYTMFSSCYLYPWGLETFPPLSFFSMKNSDPPACTKLRGFRFQPSHPKLSSGDFVIRRKQFSLAISASRRGRGVQLIFPKHTLRY